ncbi:MAG: flavodoxin domain-containing protein [Thermotogota bacterium]
MKNLLVYRSKHGSVEEVMKYIHNNLPENSQNTLINLKKNKELFKVEDADNIIIGTSVYAGTIHSEIKNFITDNYLLLKDKNVYMIMSCGDKEKIPEVLDKNFGEHRDCIDEVIYAGYAFKLEDMGFFEKTIIKKVAKIDKSENKLEMGAVNQLLDRLKL